MSGFKVPIALFNFNRPHLTRQVFDVVRQIKPARLLLVADGPRADRPDDARLCAEVRAVFDEIDWGCEVSRNFSDTNLGSFKRNSSGLNWVFDLAEEAIILEDDCVPELSFFPYCEELLERYRNDSRISVISGNNLAPMRQPQSGASYHFSAYGPTWGWASWRRVWKQVDLEMSWWEPDKGRQMLRGLLYNTDEWKQWYDLFNDIHSRKRRNAWDYQLLLSSFRHAQCAVIPRINLVSNIGFGADATHCTDENSPLHGMQTYEMPRPLVHAARVRRDAAADYAFFRAFYRRATLWQRVKSKLVRARALKRFLGRKMQ